MSWYANDVRDPNAGYGYTQQFINLSTVPLALIDRTGLITYLSPRRGDVMENRGTLKVVRRFTVTNSRSTSCKQVRNDAFGKAMEKAYEDSVCSPDRSDNGLWIDDAANGIVEQYVDIPEQGSSYINYTLGFLVCREADMNSELQRTGFLSGDALVNLEPDLSQDPKLQALHAEELTTLKSNIIVVDNEFRYQSLWTNIHGHAFRIPLIRKRGVLEEGIHLNIAGTGKQTGHLVHISFDDPEFNKKLEKYNIHFDMRSAEVGQTSKVNVSLAERLKKAEAELKKRTKEYEDLKQQYDLHQNETKLFKSNKQGNFILDIAKFGWSIFGIELKSILKSWVFGSIFA